MNKRPQSTRLLLLRHGLIQANIDRVWHGSTDSPLVNKGRRQAKRTGKWLGRGEQISATYTSPLERCRETAELASKHFNLEAVVNDDLAEMSVGEWEGTAFRELNETHNLFGNIKADQTYAPPSGESIVTVAERMTRALTQIDAQHDDDSTVLVVSHGVAISIAIAHLVDQELANWSTYSIGNCSLTELFLMPRPRLGYLNEHSHL